MCLWSPGTGSYFTQLERLTCLFTGGIIPSHGQTPPLRRERRALRLPAAGAEWEGEGGTGLGSPDPPRSLAERGGEDAGRRAPPETGWSARSFCVPVV